MLWWRQTEYTVGNNILSSKITYYAVYVIEHLDDDIGNKLTELFNNKFESASYKVIQ